MIEFMTKPFSPNFPVDDWRIINNLCDRSIHDFEFSYANYRIGGKVFTEMCTEFEEAFEKEQFWLKLKQ